MAPDAETTERHLAHLDELAEIGMVLARRLRDLPPMIGQDTARDFDLISRAVRRSILLFQTIADGHLAPAAPPAAPQPGRDPAADPAGTPRDRSDATRLDTPDRLDDIAGPFGQTVATIVRDLQTALGSSHGPAEPATEPPSRPAEPPRAAHSPARFPAGATPDRPEADTADLN